MKQGWEIKKLWEVIKLEYGKSLGKSLRKPDGLYPMYGANGIKGRTDEFYYNKKTIIVGRKGSAGEINLTEDKFWPLDVTYFVTFEEKRDNLIFLFHLLNSLELPKLAKGVKPGINRNDVYDIKVPLPPLSEQKRIVAILDKAFAAIAKAKANAEQNLKNTKELFESFMQEVFENKGEDWEEKVLGELCQFVRGPFGGSLKKSCFKEFGNAVYEQQHAIHNQFNNIRYFIDDIKFEEMKRFELLPGDLIMSCSGTMGKVAIVPDGIKRGIINQALLKLTPSNQLDVQYLKNWMNSKVFQESLAKLTVGAAIKNVASVKILKEIEITLPQLYEQQIIVQKIDAFSAETKKLEVIYHKKIEDLEELKKSILQKAFNGDLTGKEIEEQIATQTNVA